MEENEIITSEMSIEERLNLIEFRQELLFYNSEVDRLLFEYWINRKQYVDIMDLMDKIRQNIINGIEVSRSGYENKVYKIVERLEGDYHFCEYIAQAFMNEERWTEVFPALYGKMPKYDELFD